MSFESTTLPAIDITLDSLADGDARQSAVQKRGARHARLAVTIVTGTNPTAGSVVEFYLLRKVGSVADDGAGDTDAAITLQNAILVDTISVTNTSDATYEKVIDLGVAGELTGQWILAVKNSTGAALNATGHSILRQDYA